MDKTTRDVAEILFSSFSMQFGADVGFFGSCTVASVKA